MLIYILEFSGCLAVLLLFYKIFLEKENAHKFKRFYLLSILFLALIIPAITFTFYVNPTTELTSQRVDIQQKLSTAESIDVINSNINISYIIWVIYTIGVLFFSIKFIKNLFKLYLKIINNPKHNVERFTYVLVNEIITPNTFFKFIFINSKEFNSKQIPKEIFLHEQTHAIQKHSLDLIIIELFQVVFWFSPLVYIVKNAIKLNHEFLADEAVLNHGISSSAYQQTLLNFSAILLKQPFTNAMNYSFVKKRFEIMKAITTRRTLLSKGLILLPLLAILLYSFSNKEIIEHPSNNNQPVISQQDTIKDRRGKVQAYKLSLVNKAPIFQGCEDSPSEFEMRKCLSESMTKHFEDHFNFELAKSMIRKSERKYMAAFFNINVNGTISEVFSFRQDKASNKDKEKLNKEFIRVFNLVPKLKPGIRKGKLVNVRYFIGINFEDEEIKIRSKSTAY